jgi:hypothetical protein
MESNVGARAEVICFGNPYRDPKKSVVTHFCIGHKQKQISSRHRIYKACYSLREKLLEHILMSLWGDKIVLMN